MADRKRITRISGAKAMCLAREHLAADVQLELAARPPEPMYLVDHPEDLFFFRVDRGERRVGGDEIVAIRKRDGAVVDHATVGQ